MEDSILQLVLVTSIQVILPVILTAVVIPLIQVASHYLKNKLSASDLAVAIELTRQFVLAAEQNGLKDEVMGLAANKKAYVINRLETELARKGIHLNMELLSDLIEAQVHDAFKLGAPEIFEIMPVEH